MKKIFMLILALFFNSCDDGNNMMNDNEFEKINVGVIAPLTGEGATYGKSMKKGIELVFQDTNKYKIYFEDSKLSAKEGINAYKKIMLYKPYLIFGAASSGVSLAIEPLAKKDKTVLFSSISTSDKLLSSSKYFLRNVPTNSIQGKTAAEFIINTLEINNIAIYNKNDEYGKNLTQSFKETVNKLKGKIVLENSYNAEDTDFKTFLSKIKKGNIKVVFIPGHYEESAQILKQAKELSLDDTIFIGGDGSYSPKIAEIAGNKVENFYCTLMGIDSSLPFYKEFLKKFKDKYNTEPDTYDAYAYEASTILYTVLENTKTKNDIIDYIYSHEFDSLTSLKLKFKENGDIERKYGIVKFENGIFKSVK